MSKLLLHNLGVSATVSLAKLPLPQGEFESIFASVTEHFVK